MEQNLQLVTSDYDPLIQVLREFIFLCIFHQQETIVTMAHVQNFQIYKMPVPYLPSTISSPEENILASLERLYAKIDALYSNYTKTIEK